MFASEFTIVMSNMIHYTYFINCHSFERISDKSQRGKWYISYLTVCFLQFHIFPPTLCWAVNKYSLSFKHMLKYYSKLAIMHLGKKKVLVTQVYTTLWEPQIVDHQGPLSMGFSRQEYQSGYPFPSPEDLLDPRIKPRAPILWTDS